MIFLGSRRDFFVEHIGVNLPGPRFACMEKRRSPSSVLFRMTQTMKAPHMALFPSSNATVLDTPRRGGMTEINLLLPSPSVEALRDLARRRRQTVAQLLRQWIDLGLNADD